MRDYVNPDGAAYAEVAELLVAGRWSTATNGYFGPLLSWMAAPLVAIGVPSLLALRVALLVGAAATLPSLRALARRAGASRPAQDAMLLASAPFLAATSLFGLYADVLMAAALLRGLDVVLRASSSGSRWQALRAGGWLGVAYLAKAYAIPVVVVSLPLAAGAAWLAADRAHRRDVLRAFATAAAGFAVVGLGWALVLSEAYDRPTFSTSAGFNAELVTPGSAGNPFNVPGLHQPPRDDVVSAWIEPSQLPVPRVEGTTDTTATRSHRVDLAVANTRIVVGSVVRRGAVFALLALVGLVTWVRRRRWPPAALTAPLVTGVVAAAGLVLIIAIERYLWFPILATVPAAAVGLDALLARRRAWVKKVAAEFSHLDVLVNNAGITRDGMLTKMTDEQWVEVIQTNLNGCFFCTSAAIPIMTAQSYGRIINISSMNGQVPAMGQANYSASKGGIIAFTRTAALELVHSGITVNAVSPGYTDTDMFAAVPLPIQTQIKGKIPMGRFAHPEEIAKAVIFLVADGDYITGQQINVNGGAYM